MKQGWRVFPRAFATGGAWVHAPPREKSQKQGEAGSTPSPLHFSTGGDDPRHLQKEKTHKPVDFTWFCFRSVQKLLFFFFSVCFACTDGRSNGGGPCGRCCVAVDGPIRDVQRRTALLSPGVDGAAVEEGGPILDLWTVGTAL